MKDTYIIRRSDGNAVFLWMPAHVQDLLVEVDLVRIGLLTHPLRTTSWAAGSAALLTVFAGTGARRAVHGCWNADLLGLEGTLVSL